MLLNLSNHNSNSWPVNQTEAAIGTYDHIKDLIFPQISAGMHEDELQRLVESYAAKVKMADPSAVHIMGEHTFTFRLVTRLKAIGYRCIASTTERLVTEDGIGNKTSSFKFVQFRDY